MVGASRVAVAAGVAISLVLLLGLGLLAFKALETRQASSTSGGAANCAPQPCVNANGVFEADVAETRTASTGPSGDRVFRIEVTFKNHAHDPATVNGNHLRAETVSFQLRDAAGHQLKPAFDTASCPDWPSYEIPQDQVYGPEPVCFLLGRGNQPPFQMVWGPDLGFFFDDVVLPLP